MSYFGSTDSWGEGPITVQESVYTPVVESGYVYKAPGAGYGNVGGSGETVILADTAPAFPHEAKVDDPFTLDVGEFSYAGTPDPWVSEEGPWPWSGGWDELIDDVLPGDQSEGIEWPDLSVDLPELEDLGNIAAPWGAIGGTVVGEADPASLGGMTGILQMMPLFMLMMMFKD